MRTRNNMIKIILNDTELEHLNKQLEFSGLNKSVMLRKLIMNPKINPAPVDSFSASIPEIVKLIFALIITDLWNLFV